MGCVPRAKGVEHNEGNCMRQNKGSYPYFQVEKGLIYKFQVVPTILTTVYDFMGS